MLKISDRPASIRFFKDILGMKVLRHEEFDEGCKAACNGPYDGKWSKTMIGYGPENANFVLELTYNYGVKHYVQGNDMRGITINSPGVTENIKNGNWPYVEQDDFYSFQSPTGYSFYLAKNSSANEATGDVRMVTLACSQLATSVDYWKNLCGMKLYEETENAVVVGFADGQCKLKLQAITEPVDHAEAFGRVAFACPSAELPELESSMRASNQEILTPLLTLDTPGKASVEVVILADPDGHEICFVGAEGFDDLSAVDTESDDALTKAMVADKSNEWFMKNKKPKAEP